MLAPILQELEKTKSMINSFHTSTTAPLAELSALCWNPSAGVTRVYKDDAKFIEMTKSVAQLEASIEAWVESPEFTNFWSPLSIENQEKILFFSKSSYLSVRKKVSLDTINFPIFKNIDEFNDFGLKSLIEFTSLSFGLDLEVNMSSVKEYKFKKIFELTVEKDFPYFKASKENTQQNLYKNLAWLGVLKIINTPEQNKMLANFELNNTLPYSAIMELDEYLNINDLYYTSSSLFFIDKARFPKYFELETKFKKEIDVNIEREKINASIDLISRSDTTHNSNPTPNFTSSSTRAFECVPADVDTAPKLFSPGSFNKI